MYIGHEVPGIVVPNRVVSTRCMSSKYISIPREEAFHNACLTLHKVPVYQSGQKHINKKFDDHALYKRLAYVLDTYEDFTTKTSCETFFVEASY